MTALSTSALWAAVWGFDSFMAHNLSKQLAEASTHAYANAYRSPFETNFFRYISSSSQGLAITQLSTLLCTNAKILEAEVVTLINGGHIMPIRHISTILICRVWIWTPDIDNQDRRVGSTLNHNAQWEHEYFQASSRYRERNSLILINKTCFEASVTLQSKSSPHLTIRIPRKFKHAL